MSDRAETQAKETTKTKIKQLREAAHPSGSKGLWLRFLSDRQIAEVYQRLRLGQSLAKICRIAQIEWGIRPNSDPRSMAKGLRVFKERVLGEIEQLQTQERKSDQVKTEEKILTQKGKRIQEDLDALGRYRWMIDVQAERLEMIRQNEKNMNNVPMGQFDKAVKQLRESLNCYVGILMKLGILDAKPETGTLEVKTAFDGLIDSMSSQGGGAMVNALGKFLHLADQESIPLLQQQDGSFSLERNS